MGGKPRARPQKPASLFVEALEIEARRQIGEADTILAPPPPPAPRPAMPPRVPAREPNLIQRAAGAVTRVIRQRSIRDHSADPTMVISATELPSLLVSEEDEDQD